MTVVTCSVRARSEESDLSRVSARRQQFIVGVPLSFDAEYAPVTALECVLGAVGAEIVGGLRVFAKRRRVVLEEVEATVTGVLGGWATYLEVIGEDVLPHIARIEVVVFVSSGHDETTLQQLWDDTVARLPLVGTLRKTVALDTRVTFLK